MAHDISFLPGVPCDYVLRRLKKAGGNELASGKFSSPNSSAALAVNTFGWFHERPARLPMFPMLKKSVSQPTDVEVEYCARFPWAGGRHPWLDALVETPEAVIGVESKRFEPFRDKKIVDLASTYDRKVWHDQMGPYELMKDKLRSGDAKFELLDAAQLVKHAFGLVTEGRRKRKRPYLVYLFAEPNEYAGQPVEKHREDIARFRDAVTGGEVGFETMTYREWLKAWPDSDPELLAHRDAILERFNP